MPSRSSAARSASAQPSRPGAPQPRSGFHPRKVRSAGPLSRIRWDRASRVGLVVVVAIIAYLGISGLSSLISHHAQAAAGLAQVQRLSAEHHALVKEEKALHQKATILARARDLGMVKQGEQSFIVTH
jgi:cell division protein FtsB